MAEEVAVEGVFQALAGEDEVGVAGVVHQAEELPHRARGEREHQVDRGGEEVAHVVGQGALAGDDGKGVHLFLGDDVEGGGRFVRELVEGIKARQLPFPEIDVEIKTVPR